MTTTTPLSRPLAVVLLAAGEGSRMRSRTPKPLHSLGGAPLIAHAMAAMLALRPARRVVVVGHGGDAVGEAARRIDPDATVVAQRERRGTGHAVRCALPALDGFEGDLLVLYADTPLLRAPTLDRLRAALEDGAATAVLGFETATPGGYGRLILDADGAFDRIVEAADADPGELRTPLCNAGVMAFALTPGRRWLAALNDDNAKGEYYLPDLAAAARAENARVAVVRCDAEEALGVNSRIELAAAEAVFQARARAAAMAGGATLTAPETVFLAHDTRLGVDVTVEPHVVIGPGVTVEDGAVVRAFSHLEACVVRAGAVVGPYARLRPGADIGARARIGNFVEIKNAIVGAGAKANHLAYLGDASVGAGANIGAGAITCNYDGVAKHRTTIGDGAFIGSNSALVAPVRVGSGAYVGSGSVITRDVEPGALAVGRARQVERPGFAARLFARIGSKAKE